MTTALIIAMDGASTIITTGDGISAGTIGDGISVGIIGDMAFGSPTITIHGTTLFAMAIIIMVTTTMDTIIIEDVPIHTLTEEEGQDIETQA